MSAATEAKDITERFIAENECGECGYDGELIVERGGGIVSVTCPNCYFSASASEEEVNGEWQEFLATLRSLEPQERKPFMQGAAIGGLKSIFFFFAAVVLNAIDGGGRGLGR